MNVKRHTTGLWAAVIIALLATGCGKAPSSEGDTRRKFRVGVATLMSHPALDAVIANMKTELASRGYRQGDNISYTVMNANGDPNAAITIIRSLQASKPDVTVAITTPMAQVAVKEVRGLLVFSAVTDPVGAGVVDSLSSPPANVTGVSDAWPYQAQLSLARELSPGARVLGVLYNPGESASQYGIKRIEELAPSLGFEIREIPVANMQEIPGALAIHLPKVDALFLSSDNTVIAGAPAALKACLDQNKPLFVGDSGTVEKGGLAAVSVGYAGVGRETGKLVARFLAGERSIPVVVASGDEIYLNRETARMIGLQFPAPVIRRAKTVFGKP
jgi:putative tryptophan/tyrosine transport system substrate-binding protein